ncbi:hypothetical protein F5X96DRAFT_658352 [Biscogniauxia mediterranea]|nr:hypothetical protein F5X96DRAFT_658352 [Biscogniauxia mediterranea]
MAALPKGWESDYDGSRWFYRYKPTGITQFQFPKPGDEFPEFVGLGVGSLDLGPEERLASEQQVKRRISDGSTTSSIASRTNSHRKTRTSMGEEEYEMSATGYFDPESFIYTGSSSHNDVSPAVGEEDGNVGATLNQNEKGSLTAFELHEDTRQVWTPVGFVAELASNDTVKCAEELAPVELDATSSMPAPIRTNIVHGAPVELPTHKSPVERKPAAAPSPKSLQPVDSYPLVSASFAYPPLKSADTFSTETKPDDLQTEEPKVLASERPISENVGQNRFQPWTPAQRIIEQNSRLPSRNSMVLSQASVLQTQNSDLGDFGKRHSLSGPIGGHTANSDIPDALKVQTKQNICRPPSNILNSPIPTALQPAAPPSQMLASQGSPNRHPITIPGSGARHESISSGSGKPGPDHTEIRPGFTHVPSVLKPGAQQQQVPVLGSHNPQNIESFRPAQPTKPANSIEGQPPLQDSVGAQGTHLSTQAMSHAQLLNDHSSNNRVNTMPNKLPSQTAVNGLPRMNGPGFLFFHEIPSNNETMTPENNMRPGENPNTQVPISRIHNNHQRPGESHTITDDTLPVIAPLTLSKQQQSNSPQKSSVSPVSQSPVTSPDSTLDQISEVISDFHISLPQSTEDKPSSSMEAVSHISTQCSSHSNSAGVVSGIEKPSTVANTQPVSGQHPLGHNQQATTNQIVLEGVSSVSSQAPNFGGHHPSISQSLQKPPTPSQTPSQTTSFSEPQQGQTPFNYPASSITIDNSGKPLEVSGPAAHPSLQTNHTQSVTASVTNNQNAQVASQVSNTGHPVVSTAGQPPLRPSSVFISPHPQFGTQHPQPAINHVHNSSNPPGTPIQIHQGRPNGQAPIQANTGYPGFLNQPYRPQQPGNIPGHSMISPPQATVQGQPSNPPSTIMSPSQLTSVSKPTQPVVSQGQNQSSASFSNPSHGQTSRPPHSSPSVHHSSPSQSQVSSPTLSIASLNRPPSSASSHIQMSATISAIPSTFSPMSTNIQSSNLVKPPLVNQQPTHIGHNRPQNVQHHPVQGSVQAFQQPNSAPTAPSKPFPMLPGQVTPLPSQVGVPANPIPVYPQPFSGQTKPPSQIHQHPPNQQIQQVPSPRPFQQPSSALPNQAQYMPGPGKPALGQAQLGQVPPQTQIRPPQQHVHPNVHTVGQPHQGVYQGPHQPHPLKIQQPTGIPNQTYNAQQMIQSNFSVNTSTANQSPSFAPPPTVQGQQPAQAQGGQASVQLNAQGKPFNSDQAAAAFTSAGKGMKKWAKKVWQNPTIKQTTAAVGGAIIAESLGGDGVAGAALANRIYTTSQTPQPRPQIAGPQRPPGLVHAQTAPPQAQGIPGPIPQYNQAAQAVNRPQLGMQPIGVQTPGRPVMVQNQAMMGTTVNISAPQQVGAIQQRPPQPAQGQYAGRPQPPPPPPPQMIAQQYYRPGPPPLVYSQASRPNQDQNSVDPNLVAIASIGGAAIGAALRTNQQHEPPTSTSSSHPTSQEQQHEQPHQEYQEAQHHEQQQQNYEPHSESHATAAHESTAPSDSYFSPSTQYATPETATTTASTTDNTTYADFSSATTAVYVDNSTTTYIDSSAPAESNTAAATAADAYTYTDPAAYTDASSNTVDYLGATDASSFAAAASEYTTTTAYADGDGDGYPAYYAAAAATDTAYVDAGADFSVNVDVDVSMSMETVAGGGFCGGVEGEGQEYEYEYMAMEESAVSVEAEADYCADYSGGGWGEDDGGW